MLKKIKAKFRKASEAEGVDVKKKSTLRESIESTTEAIAFAEAGLHEEAKKISDEAQAVSKKILVVSPNEGFSKKVMDYALGFADRMGYEIVAMNVLDMPHQGTEPVAPYCSIIEERFKSASQESVKDFYREAQLKNIPFEHIVKVGDLDQCIKEAVRELKRVEFVISEPEALPEVAKDDEYVIPVYAISSVA